MNRRVKTTTDEFHYKYQVNALSLLSPDKVSRIQINLNTLETYNNMNIDGTDKVNCRSQLQKNLIRQMRPFSKTSPSKSPRHWWGHQDYSIPPIMPQTVTKPAIQIVGSTLKPHYWAGGVAKEGINTTIPPTIARIQGNTYKALTLPTEGRETHWEIFLALLHCIIFS